MNSCASWPLNSKALLLLGQNIIENGTIFLAKLLGSSRNLITLFLSCDVDIINQILRESYFPSDF